MISKGVFQLQQFDDSGDKDICSGYVTLSILKVQLFFFLTSIHLFFSAFNFKFSNEFCCCRLECFKTK